MKYRKGFGLIVGILVTIASIYLVKESLLHFIIWFIGVIWCFCAWCIGQKEDER